jgi:hypothetical protein
MKKNIITTLVTLIIATAVFSQSDGYKWGSDSLRRSLIKAEMKQNPLFDSNSYIIAIIEIDPGGKLGNVQLTSFKDTVLNKIVLNTVWKTKNDWLNTSNVNQYYEIPFYFMRVESHEDIKKAPLIYSIRYIDAMKVEYNHMNPIILEQYPDQH